MDMNRMIWAAFLSFLCMSMTALGQEYKREEIPETVMAARLHTYAISPRQPSVNRCSNSLATVCITIDATGNVSNSEYLSGYSELKEAALAAVNAWRYEPYTQEGKPVAVESRASIFFLGDGTAIPMYVPDGKGGTRGGKSLPLPVGCGAGPRVEKAE